MSAITVFNPLTGESSTVESNDAEQHHGVNAAGESLGNVPLGTAFASTPEPPAGPNWRWSFESSQWQYEPTLEEVITTALLLIDNAAGAARLRYITDVPGQQATYIAKAEEAQAWIGGGGTPGAYLQAEADAMKTDLQTAARSVLALSSQWGEIVGPAIEKARRFGKINVAAAATVAEANAARHAAIASLISF